MRLFVHQENQTLLWQLIQQSLHWEEFSALYQGHTNLWFKNIISLFYDKYWGLYGQKMTLDDLKKINREVMAYMIQDIKRAIAPPSAAPTAPAEMITHHINHQATHPNFTKPLTSKIEREHDIPYDRELHQRISQYEQPVAAPYVFSQQSPQSPIQSTSSLSSAPVGNMSDTQIAQLHQSYDVQREKDAKMEKAKKEFEEFQRKYNTGFERKPPPPIDFSIKLDQDRINNMDELVKRQLEEREKDLEGVSLANIQ